MATIGLVHHSEREPLQSKLTITHDEQDIPNYLEILHRDTCYNDRFDHARICELDCAELAKELCKGK